jgi:predicted DNA-binding transcriptional regulator AlpA
MNADPPPVDEDGDRLITTDELAKILRVSTSFLAKQRRDETGPDFVHLGRSVRYRRSSIRTWLDSLR